MIKVYKKQQKVNLTNSILLLAILSLLFVICLNFICVKKHHIFTLASELKPVTSLNLNSQGSLINDVSKFNEVFGNGQESYIYFGENLDTPILWRVLATGDANQYQNNNGSNALIFMDDTLGIYKFDISPNASDYAENAFWTKSEYRAKINNEYYNSWFGIGSALQNAISSTTIRTIAAHEMLTSNIITTVNNVVGESEFSAGKFGYQYGESSLVDINYDTTATNGRLIEITEDKLFALSIDELSRTAYGFGMSNDVLSQTWANGNIGDYYRKDGVASAFYNPEIVKASNTYWLRNTLRSWDSGPSRAAYINLKGEINFNNVHKTYGIRPALNLNLNSLIYATAIPILSGEISYEEENIQLINNKEAYTLYLKGLSFTNFNLSETENQPIITQSENKLIVTLNGTSATNTAGVTILLRNKETGDIQFQGYSSITSNSCELTLPTFVEDTYNVTILLQNENNNKEKTTKIVDGIFTCDINLDLDNRITSITSGWEYGNYIEPTTTALCYGETATYKYSYTGKNGPYIDDIPTNAGTYWIQATIEKYDKFFGAKFQKEFAITPKPITITINNQISMYGTPLKSLTYNLKPNYSLANSDTLDNLNIELSKETGLDVGLYDIIGNWSNSNYIVTFENESKSYEITTRPVTPRFVTNQDKEFENNMSFDSSFKNFELFVDGLDENISIDYYVNDEKVDKIFLSKTGTYNITIKFNSSSNLNNYDIENEVSLIVTITKKSLSFILIGVGSFVIVTSLIGIILYRKKGKKNKTVTK